MKRIQRAWDQLIIVQRDSWSNWIPGVLFFQVHLNRLVFIPRWQLLIDESSRT